MTKPQDRSLHLNPVVLFCYNRLEHLKKTISHLRACTHASDSILYIYSDGAKSPKNIEEVKAVREYIRNISGFREIIIREQDTNIGLAASVIAGVSDVLRIHEGVIVLEDDILVSKNFLIFMNTSLDKYRDIKKVASISAYMFPVRETLPQTFFLNHSDCWGWATWRDRWLDFQTDSKILLKEIEDRQLISMFNFNDSFPYYEMLLSQSKEEISSWAIRWYASNFLQGKLSLYPGKALVENIGLDYSGTHSGNDTFMKSKIASENIFNFPLELTEDNKARNLICKYLKKNSNPTLYKRIRDKISWIIYKLKKN